MSRAAARGAPAGRRAWEALTLALALLPGACSRHAPTPLQPQAPPPPLQIAAVSPPPRSSGVPCDSLEIWAEFTEPLDSTTVTPLNVFFKIDTRRLPILVRWDGAHRRIVVTPLATIRLLQTYTVQLSPNLRSLSGAALGTSWSWQFTVNSVRRPTAPAPADGTAGESPFVALAWSGNGSGDGAASYEVYAGTDSAAVAARAAPRLYAGSLTRILPRTRWAQDRPVYWAVTSINALTGEHLRGPVWRFAAVSASLPVDSLQVPLGFSDYALRGVQGSVLAVCQGTELVFGPSYVAGLAWNLGGVPSAIRLAGARLVLSATPGNEASLAASATGLWYTTGTWQCARINLSGTPATNEADGHLAAGQADAPGRVRFESDTLTAHLEACVRLTGYYGYLLRASAEVHCASEADPVRGPRLTLYYYRLPAAASALAARRAGVEGVGGGRR